MSRVGASIVIPVWNGRPYLGACLDALLAHAVAGGQVEVILVDDASTDGSADYVADNYSQVRLIRNRDNLGFAGACNVGLKAASGQVLVLLNQDTRVYAGWLSALCDALSDSRIGVAGCKALYPDGETIQHAGGRVEWPLAIAKHDGVGEHDVGQWDTPRQVDYVTGAALAFRRDVLEAVGFLDEGFWPGYYEDTDYCYRAREAGYEVWYVPGAVLVHDETSSLSGAAQSNRFFQQGRLRFALKHLSPDSFLRDFVPAEQGTMLAHAQGEMAFALKMAYMRAVPAVADLYPRRWRADPDQISDALGALQGLYLYPVPDLEVGSIEPSLVEYEFESSVPVVGSLIAHIRALWYNAAARWAMRHLAQQQEAINRQLRAIQARQGAANQVYVRSLVSLSGEVARLVSAQMQDACAAPTEAVSGAARQGRETPA